MRKIFLATALVATVLLAASASAVATGGFRQCDFNNDGFHDSAIGVPRKTVGAEANAGSVNVLYGSQDKLISLGDQVWTQNSPGLDDAAEENDLFGSSVECGDFNDDGYADLAIGSPQEKVGPFIAAGAFHVLFGSADGLTGNDSLFLHRDVPGVAGSASSLSYWAWTLAAGDFDGDGRDDLAVGSTGDFVDSLSGAGTVHVFYGFAGGLSTDGDKIWHRGTKGVRGKPQASGLFSRSLASGDFDGDGFEDLAIGSPGDTIGGLTFAGSVNVLYGSNSGLTAAGDDRWHRNVAGIKGSAAQNDWLGSALAAGDFDNDGYDELVIGIPFDKVGMIDGAGSVQVLRGSAAGLTPAGDKVWHRDKPGIRGTADDGDHFGYSLTTGRFNRGGHIDLAIGVPGDDVATVIDTGSVHVIYGSGSGLSGSGDQIWHQNRKNINGINEPNDGFGFSVSSGDFDGSGRDDLLIGVPFEDGPLITDSGRIAVIFGKKSGLTAGGDQGWSQDSPGIGGVSEEGDNMGRSVNGNAN